MPRPNRDNIKQWLDQSDVDFFTHFVKAWIPFNAWYRHTYDTLRNERDILDEVKSDGNRIRTRFMVKLDGGDPDSEEIRNHIATLHRRLSSDPVQDRNENRVSFENVCIGKNPQRIVSRSFYNWTYRVERQNSNNIVSTVTSSTNVVTCTITQTSGWDIDEFETHPDFMVLHINKRGPFRQCYDEAKPFKFTSLLASNPPPTDAIMMDGYYFQNDKAAIFAGLIEILYCMRNLLFHGELVPDAQANRTYEPAYYLLRYLIRCIT